MLVAAVAMMGSFLVTWSNSTFAAQRVNIANSTDSKVNLIREGFIVEDVWFFCEPGICGTRYANVTLRNTGDVAIRFSHIYINNTQVWNAGQTVAAGTVAEIKVQTNWGTKDSQSIWIKTLRGSEVKQVWKS